MDSDSKNLLTKRTFHYNKLNKKYMHKKFPSLNRIELMLNNTNTNI